MRIPQTLLPFKIQICSRPDFVTAYAGLPVVYEALLAAVANQVYRELRKALGYKEWKTVARHLWSVILLVASGGEHLSDLDILRADVGLEKLLGFKISSPAQAKDFLYRFHQSVEGRPLTAEEDAALSKAGVASIRPEGPGLQILEVMVSEILKAVQKTSFSRTATLDVDATIIAADKKLALKGYEGTVGYQPQMAWWAERSQWTCDEFRDGNVPAGFSVKEFLIRAFGALPGGIEIRRLRADSALYEEEPLSWADREDIEFAVTADMSGPLAERIRELPEKSWKPYVDTRDPEHLSEEREWAVVTFIPDWKRNRDPKLKPFRYIAIRVRPRQRELFPEADGNWRHFALVTNMNWEGSRLIRWHREKQGTVEHGHGVIKNELGGGTMPCGRFCSNAAWWRINVITALIPPPTGRRNKDSYLLELVKCLDPSKNLQNAQPKLLRFRLITFGAKLVHQARQWTLRLFDANPQTELLVNLRKAIAGLAVSLGNLRAAPA
jgi:hypothetical protein